ncbi:hypothetical protein CPJCM30710_07290 [Clostridium polyendosporum]|uniref:DUF4342 domain-containing protein n=1 Tax=Clostridium polyendosporum TaxID=69208 RepID=A0A919RYT7_9CLOT|nr:DUF4342 domain-containing protein [Clostridium polyendosporum]GIM28063.1 hypothetical protein CPJCM30710_07290 [Clostridium polyendosporum]
MSEISLEKVDQVRDRTGVGYAEAKLALEVNGGDVLEALIYIENIKRSNEDKTHAWKKFKGESSSTKYETLEEFKLWLNELIKKGNVSRVKIKREDKVIIDIPVNAGIAAGVIAIIMPQLLAIGIITAIATKLTVEITKDDGSIEVVNKMVKETVSDVKDKAVDLAGTVREKINSVKDEVFQKNSSKSVKVDDNSPVYTYTVKFDEVEKDK